MLYSPGVIWQFWVLRSSDPRCQVRMAGAPSIRTGHCLIQRLVSDQFKFPIEVQSFGGSSWSCKLVLYNKVNNIVQYCYYSKPAANMKNLNIVQYVISKVGVHINAKYAKYRLMHILHIFIAIICHFFCLLLHILCLLSPIFLHIFTYVWLTSDMFFHFFCT